MAIGNEWLNLQKHINEYLNSSLTQERKLYLEGLIDYNLENIDTKSIKAKEIFNLLQFIESNKYNTVNLSELQNSTSNNKFINSTANRIANIAYQFDDDFLNNLYTTQLQTPIEELQKEIFNEKINKLYQMGSLIDSENPDRYLKYIKDTSNIEDIIDDIRIQQNQVQNKLDIIKKVNSFMANNMENGKYLNELTKDDIINSKIFKNIDNIEWHKLPSINFIELLQKDIGISFNKDVPYMHIGETELYKYLSSGIGAQQMDHISYTKRFWEHINAYRKRLEQNISDMYKVTNILGEINYDVSEIRAIEGEYLPYDFEYKEIQSVSDIEQKIISGEQQYLPDELKKINDETQKLIKNQTHIAEEQGKLIKTVKPTILYTSHGLDVYLDKQKISHADLLQKIKEVNNIIKLNERVLTESKLDMVQKTEIETHIMKYKEAREIYQNKFLAQNQDINKAIINKIDSSVGKNITFITETEKPILYGQTDFTEQFAKSKLLGTEVEIPEYGKVTIQDIDTDIGVAKAKIKSIKPEAIKIPISEITKSAEIREKQLSKPLKTSAIEEIENKILKGITSKQGIALQDETLLHGIIDEESITRQLGNFENLSADDYRSGKIQRKLKDIIIKRAGWALSSGEEAVSSIGLAYMETMNSISNIQLKEGENIINSVLNAFEDKFTEEFHKAHIPRKEEVDYLINNLLEGYEKSKFTNKLDRSTYIHHGIKNIVKQMDPRYTYNLPRQTLEEIEEYIFNKYSADTMDISYGYDISKELGEGPSGVRSERVPITRMTNDELYKTLPRDTIFDYLATEKNKDILYGPTYDITSIDDLTSAERSKMRKGLSQKIDIFKNRLLGQDITKIFSKTISPSLIESMQIDTKVPVTIEHIAQWGLFNKLEQQMLQREAGLLTGEKFRTFTNINELKGLLKDTTMIGNIGDIQYQLGVQHGNVTATPIDELYTAKPIVVSDKDIIKQIPLRSEQSNYFKEKFMPVMADQANIELWDNIPQDRLSKLRTEYIRHTPQATMQSLRKVIRGDREFVVLDYETTGLVGKTPEKYMIPTEIYAEKVKYTTEGIKTQGDIFHKYIKPTSEVQELINNISTQATQQEIGILRNYAKFSPELQNDLLKMNKIITHSNILPVGEELADIIKYGKIGMQTVSTDPLSIDLKNAMTQLEEFIGGRIIAGQNIANADELFKRSALKTINIQPKYTNELIEMLHLEGLVNPEAKSRSLAATAKRYNIPMGIHHLASEDVNMTKQILNKQIKSVLSNTELNKLVNDAEQFKLKKGDILGTTKGYGSFKVTDIKEIDNKVIAKLFKYGEKRGKGTKIIQTNTMQELQTKISEDFTRITKEEIPLREKAYIKDRTRRLTFKGLKDYKTFAQHKENIIYMMQQDDKMLLETQKNFKQINKDILSTIDDLELSDIYKAMTTKEKVLFSTLSTSKDPIEMLEQRRKRLRNYDLTKSPLKEKIYKEAEKWYTSKQGRAIEEAYKKIEILRNTPTIGISQQEARRMYTSISDIVKQQITKSSKGKWIKTIGNIGDRDLIIDTSSATKIEKQLDNILNREKIDVKELGNIIRKELPGHDIIDDTTQALASSIIKYKDKLKIAETQDALKTLKGKQLKDFSQAINQVITTGIENKYRLIPEKEKLTQQVLSHINDISKATENLSAQYLNLGIAIDDISISRHILDNKGNLTTINKLMDIANSYSEIDWNNIKQKRDAAFNSWINENKISGYQKIQRYRTDFFKSYNENVSELLNKFNNSNAQDKLRKASNDAFNSLVDIATKNDNLNKEITNMMNKGIKDYNILKEKFPLYKSSIDALEALKWKPISILPEMNINELKTQLMTKGKYRGEQLANIPLTELEQYKTTYDPDKLKRYRFNTEEQMSIRITEYLNKIEEAGIEHKVPENFKYKTIIPEFVEPGIRKSLSELKPPTPYVDFRPTHNINAGQDLLNSKSVRKTTERISQLGIDNLAHGKMSRGKALLLGGGIALAGFLAGGMRFPSIINSDENDEVAPFEKGTKTYKDYSTTERQSGKIIREGADIKIHARGRNVNAQQLGENTSSVMQNTLGNNVNINVKSQQDNRPLSKSELENIFVKIIEE